MCPGSVAGSQPPPPQASCVTVSVSFYQVYSATVDLPPELTPELKGKDPQMLVSTD